LVEDKQKLSPILLWFEHRINKNKNCIVVVVGPTGSGKSYSSLKLCLDLSKRFGTNFSLKDNVSFSFENMLKQTMLPKNKKKGTCFMFEEIGSTGSGGASGNWQSKQNQFCSAIFQTNRHMNQIFFLTLPLFSSLTADVRKLCHMKIEMVCINPAKQVSVIDSRVLQTNSSTGKTYCKKLRFKLNGVSTKLKFSEIKILPKEIIKPYEKMKENFSDDLKKRILEYHEQKTVVKEKKKDFITPERITPLFEAGLTSGKIALILNKNIKTIKDWKSRLNFTNQVKN